jgi:hypothetical protein
MSASLPRRPLALAILFAALALGTAPSSAAPGQRLTVRRIGKIEGVLARKVRRQVRFARLHSSQRSPILVQGKTLRRLRLDTLR